VEFNKITVVEMEMVEMFKGKYGHHSLDEFGNANYQGSLTSIMFDYWRSFLAVKCLVEERFHHDIQEAFNEYQKWHKEGRVKPLTAYFKLENFFS